MLINASIRHEVTSACQASCISDTMQGLHKKSYVDKCYGWCGCRWQFSCPSCTRGSLVGFFLVFPFLRRCSNLHQLRFTPIACCDGSKEPLVLVNYCIPCNVGSIGSAIG